MGKNPSLVSSSLVCRAFHNRFYKRSPWDPSAMGAVPTPAFTVPSVRLDPQPRGGEGEAISHQGHQTLPRPQFTELSPESAPARPTAPAGVPLKDQQETLPSHPPLLVVLLTGPDPAPPPSSEWGVSPSPPDPCHCPHPQQTQGLTASLCSLRTLASPQGAPAAASSPGSHWRPVPGPPPPGSPLHPPLGPPSPRAPRDAAQSSRLRTPARSFSCAAA